MFEWFETVVGVKCDVIVAMCVCYNRGKEMKAPMAHTFRSNTMAMRSLELAVDCQINVSRCEKKAI